MQKLGHIIYLGETSVTVPILCLCNFDPVYRRLPVNSSQLKQSSLLHCCRLVCVVALQLSSRYQHAFASLVWCKSAASCEQARRELIVKTFYPHAYMKVGLISLSANVKLYQDWFSDLTEFEEVNRLGAT